MNWNTIILKCLRGIDWVVFRHGHVHIILFQSSNFDDIGWMLFLKRFVCTILYILDIFDIYDAIWVDTSAGGLIVSESIINPVVSVPALTWFIIGNYHWNVQFLINIMIIKAKLHFNLWKRDEIIKKLHWK